MKAPDSQARPLDFMLATTVNQVATHYVKGLLAMQDTFTQDALMAS